MFKFYVYHSITRVSVIVAANFDDAEAIARSKFADITNINKGGRL